MLSWVYAMWYGCIYGLILPRLFVAPRPSTGTCRYDSSSTNVLHEGGTCYDAKAPERVTLFLVTYVLGTWTNFQYRAGLGEMVAPAGTHALEVQQN